MSGKTQSICIHPGLWLYKQRGSPFWYVRLTHGGVTKAKSTGTTDVQVAIRRAREFFVELLLRTARGSLDQTSPEGLLSSQRFDSLGADVLDEKHRTLCHREWRNLRNILHAANGPGWFFGRMDVRDITTDTIRRYLRFAEENSTTGKLSPHTLKRHLSLISGVLKLAVERQLIPSVPPMPRVKIKDQPRPWFTSDEYKILLRTARRLAAEAQSTGSADAS